MAAAREGPCDRQLGRCATEAAVREGWDGRRLQRLVRRSRTAAPVFSCHVRTDRPSRYLAQLCMHPSQMHIRPWLGLHLDGGATRRTEHAESSDTGGTIDVDWGRCTLQAGPQSSILRAAVTDQDSLQYLHDRAPAEDRRARRTSGHLTTGRNHR
ncbi:DUF2218 domain-containing protein [Streptomyces sp900116325]|uniref:DUF2218 domain-containing protein n=1 Tax=Streptomyces sp. 900116325 TaxID=3154295 RepID=UPI0034062CE1